MDVESTVVNTPVTQEQPLDGIQPATTVSEEAMEPAQAGDKTPPNLLLKSLQEEREKRKQLEERLTQLESSALSSDEEFSDEGKALRGEIKSLAGKVSTLESELTKKDVLIAHPVLQEKWSEFEEFRADPDNKGMNLRTAAKAYLIENGLLDVPRKGLEKPTGGPRVPQTSGMTADDVKILRTTNFKKYQEMLAKGQIKIE